MCNGNDKTPRERIDQATKGSSDYYGIAVNKVNGWLMRYKQPASEQTARFVIANVNNTKRQSISYTSAHWNETWHFGKTAILGGTEGRLIPFMGAFANFLGGFVNPQTLNPALYRNFPVTLGIDETIDYYAAISNFKEPDWDKVATELEPKVFTDS
ncbi:hypothetical protein [Acidocella sp.]|uniref:hypothetical protein n=1 Tax=Acidocella sp. TaxID=50710 RepID=UPI003CFE6583